MSDQNRTVGTMVFCVSCQAVIWAHDHDHGDVRGLCNMFRLACPCCGAVASFDQYCVWEANLAGLDTWAYMQPLGGSQRVGLAQHAGPVVGRAAMTVLNAATSDACVGTLYQRGAIFNPGGTHRYALHRHLGFPALDKRSMLFVMLNPSTADVATNDATVRRCLYFARREDMTDLLIGNLWPLVSTSPRALFNQRIARGDERLNETWLRTMAAKAERIVCAWGHWGEIQAQGRHIHDRICEWGHGDKLRCLGTTLSGEPRHPLRLRRDTPLEPFYYEP